MGNRQGSWIRHDPSIYVFLTMEEGRQPRGGKHRYKYVCREREGENKRKEQFSARRENSLLFCVKLTQGKCKSQWELVVCESNMKTIWICISKSSSTPKELSCHQWFIIFPSLISIILDPYSSAGKERVTLFFRLPQFNLCCSCPHCYRCSYMRTNSPLKNKKNK